MREPRYTITYGGVGDAWKIVFLPLGYGPSSGIRVAWSRPAMREDPDDNLPDDVVQMRDELNERLIHARGFDVMMKSE